MAVTGWIGTREAPPSADEVETAVAGRPIPEPPPFEAAMREAARAWILAQQRVARQLEAQPMLEADAGVEHARDAFRRGALVRDKDGCLRDAREALRRALAEARTPAERSRAMLLLARVLCDAGAHVEELAAARGLSGLRPDSPGVLATLQRAARCNRRWRLWQATSDRLEALRQKSDASAALGTCPNGTFLP